jgi:hypothetical protein
MLCGPRSGTREKSNEIARVYRNIQYVSKLVAMHAQIKDVKLFSAKHRDQNTVYRDFSGESLKIEQSPKVSIPM